RPESQLLHRGSVGHRFGENPRRRTVPKLRRHPRPADRRRKRRRFGTSHRAAKMTHRLTFRFGPLRLPWSLVISHWSFRLCFIVIFTFLAAAQPPTPVQTPPLPPSPVQQFREWLAMKPEDRAKAVAEYPADKQKVLLKKLLAYE